jgi:integrase
MQQTKPRPMNTFRVWIDALRDELKFASDWTARDFRRTAATGMGKLGVTRSIIGRVLNHTESGVTGVYDRYDALAEKRDALIKWDAPVAKIVA